MNVIRKTTPSSLSDHLSVKKKYKLDANGSIGKWWFVVRGEKSDIESLVEVWDRVSLHTAWRLEDMFSFADDHPLPHPSSPSIPTYAAVVDQGHSEGGTVDDNGHMENNVEPTSMVCSEQSTVVEQSLATPDHDSCQSNASSAIPSYDNSPLVGTNPYFLEV